MKLLLDTHALIWTLGHGSKLPISIQRLIKDARNTIYFSAASIFKIGAKRSHGRRTAPGVPADQILRLAEVSGFVALPITPAHAAAVESIAPFHGDPFDRLLLAQAVTEGLQLVTHDGDLAAYDARTILF